MSPSSSPPSAKEECELLYYRLMLPNWLRKNAHWRATFQGNDLNLVVNEDSSDWENVLRVPLIPKGVLKKDEDITVKIKVGTVLPLPPPPPPPVWRPRPPPRPRRRDPLSYMITDGEWCVGIQIVDPSMYGTTGPYRAVEGGFANILRNPNLNVASTVSSTANIDPDQFQLMYKPSEFFGTAYCAVDSGHKIVAQYSDSLQLDKGLWLDLYRFERAEVYNINYIEVEIYKNNPVAS